MLSSNQLTNDFIQPIHERKIPLHCIVGNHDVYFKNNLEINAIDQLYGKSTFQIDLIDKPKELEIGGCKLLLVPWICQDNQEACYKALSESTASVVMGHFEIAGFEMHRGSLCETGISTDIFKRFEHVFSGHFHHKSHSGNITYLGCPYEMTWADYDDPKGFHVFDTETLELTFIKNPYSIFHKFVYDETEISFEDLEAIDYSIFEGIYMKVICKNRDDSFKFSTFVDRLTKAGVYNLQIVEDLMSLEISDSEELMKSAKSTIELLDSYVDQTDINLNKKNLKELFRSLYQGALDIE